MSLDSGWIVTFIHAQNTFSSNSTTCNPYVGKLNYKQYRPAKVEITSCRIARECVLFVYAWLYVTTQLEFCLHEQTQLP